MEGRKRMCRFCLRACEYFQVIDANTTNTLDKLQLKINQPASRGSVMCTSCAETLMNSSSFLATCNDTHRNIVSLLNNKENAKVDLTRVYLSKDEKENRIVCGFCMGLVKSCSAVTLDYETGNVMLEKCLPELDLSIFEKLIICAPCHESLDNCFRFVKNFLNIEEEIQKYCEAVSIDSKDLVELSNVQEYISRNMLKSDVIKEVETFCDDGQYANKEVEYIDFSLLGVEKQEVTSSNILVCKEEHDKYVDMVDIEEPVFVKQDNEIKHENVNFGELEDQKFLIKDGSLVDVPDRNLNSVQQFPPELVDTKFITGEDIEIKTEQDNVDSIQESSVGYKIAKDPLETTSETRPKKYMKPDTSTDKSSLQVTMPKCELRSSNTKHKRSFVFTSYYATHKMLKCATCSYETRYKHDLKRHSSIHKSPSEVVMVQCEMCPYKTKRKDSLKQHLLTHKSSSEITMFKCELCSYETKRKDSLKNHLINHKSSSEVDMLKCEMCLYEARHKHHLKRHLLIHKSALEVTMFKCAMCSFESKHKGSLRVHDLTHKRPAEINMLKCAMCSYEAKLKCSLKKHLLTHKSPAEISMLKCEMCSYETKRADRLKQHLLTHKSLSEIKTFKCEMCLYEAKRKSSLKRHLLTHKSPADINTLKCEMCSFETKRKNSLEQHLLTHKSVSEIKTFKCETCSYEAKRKSYLKKHLMTHRSSAGMNMLKCETCSYETKRKDCLSQHLLSHKSLSEIKTFKCEMCPYEAKLKFSLKRHLLTHKSPAEKK